MSFEVLIKVTSKLNYFNGEKEIIKHHVKGNCYKKNTETYLRYKESPEQQMGDTVTLIKWNQKNLPVEVSIIRQGDTKMNQVFKEGLEYKSTYNSPHGTLQMEIKTYKVIIKEEVSRGSINLSYVVKINNQDIGNYLLNVEYKEVGEKND